ncbi:hypothetical protein [Streptomyces sp. NPDC002564]|uniref:hypothetical protein n=1 Tax=Streptomyces sp. NPDC002564 TaxID=3364649 RepID=UPI0036A88AAE
MNLHLIGKDPESGDHGSPTLWLDTDTRDLVVQGWAADELTRATCLADGPIPDHEAIVRIPPRMIPLLREVLRVADAG